MYTVLKNNHCLRIYLKNNKWIAINIQDTLTYGLSRSPILENFQHIPLKPVCRPGWSVGLSNIVALYDLTYVQVQMTSNSTVTRLEKLKIADIMSSLPSKEAAEQRIVKRILYLCVVESISKAYAWFIYTNT